MPDVSKMRVSNGFGGRASFYSLTQLVDIVSADEQSLLKGGRESRGADL